VLPNVFLRGEYEYVSFAGVSGTKASINTARVAAGFEVLTTDAHATAEHGRLMSSRVCLRPPAPPSST